MNIWIKRSFVALLVLLLIFLVGVAIFIATFNANKYKSQVEQFVHKRYGRTLSIEGDLALSVFPNVALSANKVVLSEANSTDTFIDLNSLRIGVSLWPLFSKNVVVNNLEISGLSTKIVKGINGEFNFQSLLNETKPSSQSNQAKGTASSSASKQQHVAIDIKSIKINNSLIEFYDQQSKANYSVSNIEAKTGQVRLGETFDLTVNGDFLSRAPSLEVGFKLGTQLNIDLEQKNYQFSNVNINISGDINDAATETLIKGLDFNASLDHLMLNADIKIDSPKEVFEWLSDANAQGKIAINKIVSNELRIDNFTAKALADNSTIKVSDLRAALYGGSLQADLVLSANQQATINAVFTGIDVAQLTRDYANEERASGNANVKAALSMKGITSQAIIKTLTGTMDVDITNGAWQGIDLDQTMNEVRDAAQDIRNLRLPVLSKLNNPDRSTKFDTLNAQLHFQNGQGTLKGLLVESPKLRVVHGQPAIVDLVNSRLNIVIKASKRGGEGKEGEVDLSRLQGVDVPVHIKGPIASPSYSIELKGMLGSITSNPDTLKSIGKSLKGLFR